MVIAIMHFLCRFYSSHSGETGPDPVKELLNCCQDFLRSLLTGIVLLKSLLLIYPVVCVLKYDSKPLLLF
jgi:hypothetical protein